jgi:hypothetical protein
MTPSNEQWIALALLYGEPGDIDQNKFEKAGCVTRFRETAAIIFPEMGDLLVSEAIRLYILYRDWYWTSYLIEKAKHLK